MRWTVYTKRISKSVKFIAEQLTLLDVEVKIKLCGDDFAICDTPFALAVGVTPAYTDGAKVKVREDIFSILKKTAFYKDLDDFSLAKLCRIPQSLTPFYLGGEQKLCLSGTLAQCDITAIPDDFALCRQYFDQLVIPKIYGHKKINSVSYLKLFGVNEEEIFKQCLALSQRGIKLKSITKYCDTTISIIDFAPKRTDIAQKEESLAADAVKFEEENSQSDICAAICQALTKKYAKEIYCYDRLSLEQAVIELLIIKKKTLALAESVTGGMIASKLVNVPDTSAVFLESAVTYTNVSKTARLGVKEGVLNMFTAVSAEVAKQMAEGALKCLKADFALSITGYAQIQNSLDLRGDLCYICIAGEQSPSALYSLNIKGERNEVRQVLSNYALFYLLKYLRTNN